MPVLTDILDEKFLHWLQSTITSTLGKMSVVFEDVSGEPIGAVRMFAPRVDEAGQNLCEHMIDCDKNPAAKKACKDSDAESARQAGSKLKTYLYRCHWGKGFVNLAIPIRIWENVVVGNLYAGQFLFKIPKNQQDKFIEELRKHEFLVPEGQTLEKIVRSMDSNEIYDFYKAVVPQELRSTPGFREDDFLTQFKRQQDSGVSSSEFMNAVSLLETLANYLSDLGNRLYTLKAFVDLKRRFPVSLSAQHKTDLESLEQNIERLILKKKESLSPDERAKAVASVQRLSLKSLLLLKDYETQYLTNLFRPYLEHVLMAKTEIQQLALQFYFLRAYYEMERYPRIRGLTERNYKVQPREEGDRIWNQFLDVSANIGEYEGHTRSLVTEGLIKLHENAPFLLKAAKLVSTLMHVYRNDRHAIAEVLHTQGIYRVVAQDLLNSVEVTVSQYRVPLHIILKDMEKVAADMKQINDAVLSETGESSELDIEEIRKYIEEVTRVRNDIISLVAFNPDFAWALNERRRIDLRYDRAFLNSGGLGITHGAVLEAEKWWLAERNESGPVGISLEDKLNSEVEKARTSVASLIGSKSPDDIVLTSSTTSSLKFVLDSIRFQQGDEIVFTDLEHDVVVCLVDHLARKFSVIPEISKISDCYEVSSEIAQRVSEKISARTKLVVLSHVTFSTGSIFPLNRVIKKCRETYAKLRKNAGSLDEGEILFLVDGAQAVANIPVDVKDIGCDFYAFDGHKWLLGPEGTGALYIKEFAKKIKRGSFFFPVNTAFMVSPYIAHILKVVNGNGYELGTNDAAKIIGLLASINVVTTLGLDNIVKRKELLISRFLESVKKNRCYSIVNPRDAPKTGIICIRIEGCDTTEHYRDLILKLQELNVFARYIKKPASLRFCFHYYNSESDVDTAISSLNSLIQRTEIHRANRDLVKEDIKNRIIESIKKGPSGGLIVYGPPGSGKTTAIEESLDDLRSKRKLKDWIKIKEEEIYSGKASPQHTLTKLLKDARKNAPSCIFLDEIDGILPKDKTHAKPGTRGRSRYLSALVATFVTIYDEIQAKGEKVFFIGTANEIENVSNKVKKRRMPTAYFPLPSFESRLQFLVEEAQKTKEVENIAYERIAAATDLYSMSDLKSLWNKALKLSKGLKIEQQHLEEALESVKPNCDEETIEDFEARIKKEGSEILSHKKGESSRALKVH